MESESLQSIQQPAVPSAFERKWAHDVRNAFNCVRLCTAAIAICPEPGERLELLTEIEIATDRTIELLDGLPSHNPFESA